MADIVPDGSQVAFRLSDVARILMQGSLACALRTFYEETAEFRFAYPLVAVPEAGQKESLHYYWFKYKKRPPNRTFLRLDSIGIAMVWMRTTGVVWMLGFIAMHAMQNLGHYLRSRNQEHLNTGIATRIISRCS